jgi:hypothetical protein
MHAEYATGWLQVKRQMCQLTHVLYLYLIMLYSRLLLRIIFTAESIINFLTEGHGAWNNARSRRIYQHKIRYMLTVCNWLITRLRTGYTVHCLITEAIKMTPAIGIINDIVYSMDEWGWSLCLHRARAALTCIRHLCRNAYDPPKLYHYTVQKPTHVEPFSWQMFYPLFIVTYDAI